MPAGAALQRAWRARERLVGRLIDVRLLSAACGAALLWTVGDLLSVRGAVTEPVTDVSAGQVFAVAKLGCRTGDTLEVWPGICPHEGAPIEVGQLKGATVKCAWHGLEFGPRRMDPGSGRVVMCGAALELTGDQLNVGPAPTLAPVATA